MPWLDNAPGDGIPQRTRMPLLLEKIWLRMKSRSVCCGYPSHPAC